MVRGRSGRSVMPDWPTRLEIAIEEARRGCATCTMKCFPTIVHRVVKSSDILLDSESNAKISDLGLTRTLMKVREPESKSACRGRFFRLYGSRYDLSKLP